ncbi:MAG: hypothetical protein AAF333_09800 [Planctomycetota bacterium]
MRSVIARAAPAYRCTPLATLAPQWLALAEDRRVDLLRRAEALHDSLDPDAAYPLEFLAFRLTGFRRDYGDDSLLVGSAVLPDLRLLIDQISKTLTLSPSEGNARTVEQLAADLNVSTKTLSRWRKDGLRWRWVTPGTGGAKSRRVIAFTADAVEHYRGNRPDRVAKASSFTQLTDAQRERLIQRARRLAATTDATFNQVAAHLAKRTGRALETVRLILEKQDRDHPEEPLFADRTGPLTSRQKRLISRAHRMGVGVGKLAERFRRSRATIHRVILDRRAARAMRLKLGYVANPQFDRPDAADVYLRTNLDPEKSDSTLLADTPRSAVPVDGLPAELRPLYVQPIVSPDKIRSLFLRYNFLKHRAQQTRERFAHAPARARDLDLFEQDVARAARGRSLLVTWHLPVILSVARRHLVGKPSNTPTRLIQLLEVGNPLLIDAVETYDAAASPTFESVLTNRLLQAFATAPGSHRGKALRRATAAEVMQRILDLADESGVHLAITEDPPPRSEGAPDLPNDPVPPRAGDT